MRTINRFLAFFFVALWSGTALGAAVETSEDPEEMLRVARLSHVEGTVTMQRTVDEEWVEASLNIPLMEGDKLYTGVNSRAEMELEDEVVVRLDEESFLHIEALNPARTQLGIVQGTVAINARAVDYYRPWVAVNTPSATAVITEYAQVRVQVGADGSTEMRVRRGRLEVETGPNSIRRVERDQRLLAYEPQVFMVVPGVAEDDFDQWCDLRDARHAASLSPTYVTTRVSGYSDLDRHGEWIEVVDYGRVWRPRVTVVDWAPYRYGRWVWRHRCGWVWVSDEPWGWVPYHYGRWVHLDRYRWCWVPHDILVVRRPVWRPALVGFTYADSGVYFSLTIGGGYYRGPCVGWFPLGPRDPYHGWYWHRAPDRWHRYDHRDRDHRYQNLHVAKAVSVVPREDFGLNRYERLQGSTLQPAQAERVRVGARAREELQPNLFRAPEKPGDLRTRPAPPVASNQVQKRGVLPREIVQARGKPQSPEKPTVSPGEDPRMPRSAKPGAPNVEIAPRGEPDRRRTSSESSEPQGTQIRRSTEKPTDAATLRDRVRQSAPAVRDDVRRPPSAVPDKPDNSVRQERPSVEVYRRDTRPSEVRQERSSVEVYGRDTRPFEVRSLPARVEPSRPSYSSPAPRRDWAPPATDDAGKSTNHPYQSRMRTFESPSQKPESSSSSRSSFSSRPPSVPAPAPAPRQSINRARPSSPSPAPAQRSAPSVQRPSAPASSGSSPRSAPAPASRPAPNNSSSRGRR